MHCRIISFRINYEEEIYFDKERSLYTIFL